MLRSIVDKRERTMDATAWAQALGLLFLAKCEPGLTCGQAWARVTNATQADNLTELKGKRTKLASRLWHIAKLPIVASIPIGALRHELENN